MRADLAAPKPPQRHLPREIRLVLMRHPGLGAYGFDTESPDPRGDFAEQVATARRWLDESPERTAQMLRSGDSYGIKHRMEEAIGGYLSNGAVIVAAALVGYSVQRTSQTGKNAVFPSRRC